MPAEYSEDITRVIGPSGPDRLAFFLEYGAEGREAGKALGDATLGMHLGSVMSVHQSWPAAAAVKSRLT